MEDEKRYKFDITLKEGIKIKIDGIHWTDKHKFSLYKETPQVDCEDDFISINTNEGLCHFNKDNVLSIIITEV